MHRCMNFISTKCLEIIRHPIMGLGVFLYGANSAGMVE